MTAPSPDPESTLYELLAQPAPAGVAAGETRITATKETVDADAEESSDDDVIYT
jgi:hypothetical protein